MDPGLGFSDYVNGFQVEQDSVLRRNGVGFDIQSPDLSLIDVPFARPSSEPPNMPSPVPVRYDDSSEFASLGSMLEVDSCFPNGDSDSSGPVLKYISQMLMEENMEDEILKDPCALQDTEKSLYEVLGKQYPESNICGNRSSYGNIIHCSTRPSICAVNDNCKSSQLQAPLPSDYCQIQSSSRHTNSQFSVNGLMGTSSTGFMTKNVLSNVESILQFNRGFEEARKFLPSGGKLSDDPENNTASTSQSTGAKNGFKGRKHHEREDIDSVDERSAKQSAFYVDEVELSEMFDKVLHCNCKNDCSEAIGDEGNKTLQKNGHSNEFGGGETSWRDMKRKTIDLCNLLRLCAEAVSTYDYRTAGEFIKQIRDHSSPLGDGSQRLAHYFANGLEARLEGSGTGTKNFLLSLTSRKIVAADALKAHKVYLSVCPFEMLAICFANKMICRMAEKTTTLHVIDFGILFGLQWPLLIQLLSTRPGGPPKLRITGIELPQIGFRPTERVEETGLHLAKYCKRFNVPFEYTSIAVQRWETIKLEDLKIDRNEMLAVNNLFRFENLLDDMVEVDCECPRDAVLKLIRSMNPDIFVHSVSSGAYNSPYFVRRFKEAVFHFSAIYDALDTTIPREDPRRLLLENEFWGRKAMNVIACEGSERLHRPETYKQWQLRTLRTGFKQLPLDQELMQILRNKMKTDYHEDFLIDQNGHWMLQGWKGKILFASSCWIHAQDS